MKLLKLLSKSGAPTSQKVEIIHRTDLELRDVKDEYVPKEMELYLNGDLSAAMSVTKQLIKTNLLVDCSLVVRMVIEELVYYTKVETYHTKFMGLYQHVVAGEPLPEGVDEDDVEQMREWCSTTDLPEDLRKRMMAMFIYIDDLDEHLRELSQVAWARLNMWRLGRV